ncbi:unnamed protein product, partial [Mesorhabditis belari]|uniref:Homeobox domain-containing protein n=1 Tax=Mesorhabditis belari TaxID=2138241 RepID=A0AAF3EAZ2_9BILA
MLPTDESPLPSVPAWTNEKTVPLLSSMEENQAPMCPPLNPLMSYPIYGHQFPYPYYPIQYPYPQPTNPFWKLGNEGEEKLEDEGSDNEKRKRRRVLFDPWQYRKLEERFQKSPNILQPERREFSQKIGLTENQIKIWFQNKRYKMRKRSPGSSESSEFQSNEGAHRWTRENESSPICSEGSESVDTNASVTNRLDETKSSNSSPPSLLNYEMPGSSSMLTYPFPFGQPYFEPSAFYGNFPSHHVPGLMSHVAIPHRFPQTQIIETEQKPI